MEEQRFDQKNIGKMETLLMDELSQKWFHARIEQDRRQLGFTIQRIFDN